MALEPEVPCPFRNLTTWPAAEAVLLEVPPIGARRLPPQPPSLEAARSSDADVTSPSSELVAARLFDATLTPSPALSRLARLAGTLDQHAVALDRTLSMVSFISRPLTT
ncbi:unnamed protein product, partial [Laminaria digitata]